TNDPSQRDATHRQPHPHIAHAYVNARLHGQELGPVDPAEGLPQIIDARGVQIRKAVAFHVHTDLDDPDQLHQIRDGLPLPVAVSDDGPWWGRADTFVIPDDAVAVLVHAAPAFEECYRRADARLHRQGAERPEAVTNDVDGDGRNPLLRQGGSQGQRIAAPGTSTLFAAPGTVAEDRHRPPTRGPG